MAFIEKIIIFLCLKFTVIFSREKIISILFEEKIFFQIP